MPVRPFPLVVLALALGACGDDPGAVDAGASDAARPIDAAPRPDAAPDANLNPGASCAQPLALDLGVDLVGDTTGFPVELGANCSLLAGQAPQVVHRIDLGRPDVDLLIEAVVDETARPPFDAVVTVRGSCNAGGPCADAGWGERLEALEVSGDWLITVDGTSEHGGADHGAYTLRTRTRAIVGADLACDPVGLASRCADGLACVATTCQPDSAELACQRAVDLGADLADGLAVRDGRLHAYAPSYHQVSCAFDPLAGEGEDLYRLVLAAPADLVASTDFAGTEIDTVLALRTASCDGAELGCHDDVDAAAHRFASRLEVAALPAGVYYLVVDRSSGSPVGGAYHLEIALTP